MSRIEHATTDEKVAAYQCCQAIFTGLIKEMRELSKKKADATLSNGKVKIINRALEDLRAILADEPESKYLDLLDDEDLPHNSDAVLVMVQYESALNAFRRRYFRSYIPDLGEDVWMTQSTASDAADSGDED